MKRKHVVLCGKTGAALLMVPISVKILSMAGLMGAPQKWETIIVGTCLMLGIYLTVFLFIAPFIATFIFKDRAHLLNALSFIVITDDTDNRTDDTNNGEEK